MRLLPLCGLAGCIGLMPFRNEPPELLSVNGVALERRARMVRLGALEPGETLELSLEVKDPERDEVQVWFPYIDGAMEFAPDDRQGLWHSPDWLVGPYYLELVLEDDRDPPARSGWQLEVRFPGGDDSGLWEDDKI